MKCPSDVKLPVYLLVIFFGVGAWISVNGLWVELPILVHQAPEGWNLPSYITIIIQIANIGPIMYTLLNKCAPTKIYEKHGVFFIVAIGSAASLMLVFLWKETAYVAGAEHSTGLLISVFLLSLVDCTSSVVFLPYMSVFKPQYISGYYIGEGLSGLIPGVVALGQNVGKTICVNQTVNATTNETQIVAEYVQPHFPVEDFFYFLFTMMLVCGLAFLMLHYLPYCKREHVSMDTELAAEIKYINASEGSFTSNGKAPTYEANSNSPDPFKYSEFEHKGNSESQCDITLVDTPTAALPRRTFIILLVQIGVVNALTNGILSSIQSYATLPYGDQAYHLSAILTMFANPLACFIVFFLPVLSVWIVSCVSCIGCGLAAYILYIAANSPVPPMVDETIGAVLIVAASVVVSGLLSFTKVTIATIMRQDGRKALLWIGIVTQIGSCLGAILMFVLVNELELFTQKYACT